MLERATRPATTTSWVGYNRAAALGGLILALTAMRFIAAGTIDLRSDEAYYWTWSLEPALSFLDQPPMVAWFIRMGTALFGDTLFGVRFAFLLSLPLIEFFLGDLVRRKTGSWAAAVFTVVAIEATINYGMVILIAEPSIPLLLFSSVMLWSLCRLDESSDGRWWLAIGAAAGLMLLSKYIALLLVPAVLVFLATPGHRRWLATPLPWAAAFLAMVLFCPVLLWNAQHDWASFRFQAVRLGGGSPGPKFALDYLLNTLLFIGPVLAPAAGLGALALFVRAFALRDATALALAMAFLFPAAFFALRSVTMPINTSWFYFMWPLGIAALAVSLPWREGLKALHRWTIGSALTAGSVLLALLYFHALLDTNAWLGRGDPVGKDAGFEELAARVREVATDAGATWIVTSDYRTYAMMKWHLHRSFPVIQVNERSRFLGFETPSVSGRALYIFQGRQPSPLIPAVGQEEIGPLDRVWRGVVMGSYKLNFIDGWAPDMNPPTTSEAYLWPDLA